MTSPNSEIKLQALNLTKKFSRKTIFENINFTLIKGSSAAITGKNGSGKSTLIKIIANLLSQSSGQLNISINSSTIKKENLYKYTGFVSPYLSLYDEFTGFENLKLVSDIRGIKYDGIDNALKRVGLFERKDDLLKIYSSGMKQRLKIAFAIQHNPDILLLDEPTSNLDSDGIAIVDEIANEFKNKGVLIIATNDPHERSLCEEEINLDKHV